MEALDATQTRAAAILKAGEAQATRNRLPELLQSALRYVESEKACVSFLQSRLNRNLSEVDALAAELQRETPTEEKLARVVQLRRAIASDKDALSALRSFAAGIERKLAEVLDGATAEAQKEVLVPIYVAFFEMGVPKTISMDVYNALVDAVKAAPPKPEPPKREEKEEEEEEEEEERTEEPKEKEKESKERTKEATANREIEAAKGTEKQKGKGNKKEKENEKKQNGTGKKWGVVKQPEVKSVDAIQKELQASRQK